MADHGVDIYIYIYMYHYRYVLYRPQELFEERRRGKTTSVSSNDMVFNEVSLSRGEHSDRLESFCMQPFLLRKMKYFLELHVPFAWAGRVGSFGLRL